MNLSEQQTDYLQNFINSVAGFCLPINCFDEQKLAKIFQFLTRQEEIDNLQRDQWGNWEGSYSEAFLDGKLSYPWIDGMIQTKALSYLEANPTQQVISKYPDNKPFALCITHDVDNINYYPSISVFLRALQRIMHCKSLSFEAVQLTILKTIKDVFTHKTGYLEQLDFERFIGLEESYGFKSTFYCFSDNLLKPHFYDSYYRFNDYVYHRGLKITLGDMLRSLQIRGWDIGLHGSYKSAFDQQILLHEKQNLERLLRNEVNGIRQHWMHFDIKQTPDIHNELGFSSDSTLGYNRFIGFRSGTSHPHKLWNAKQSCAYKQWEIPLSAMDGSLFYANSMELDADLAISHCIKIMDRVQAIGGVLTINWHPDHLNKPRFWAVYKELLQEASIRNAWGCSIAQLTHRWNDYHRDLIAR